MLGFLRCSHQAKMGCVIPVERTLEKGKWDEVEVDRENLQILTWPDTCGRGNGWNKD